MSKTVYQHPEVECLDRDAILAIQKGKLAALGGRLATSPDWVAHFRSAGMSPADLKANLRDLYPFPMLTNDMSAIRRFIATSGTTGLPVMFGMTDHDLDHLLAYQMCRILRTAGIKPNDRFYQGYGYGLWVGGLALDVGLKAYWGATITVAGQRQLGWPV
jgi:phenylacetate-CoA ligase